MTNSSSNISSAEAAAKAKANENARITEQNKAREAEQARLNAEQLSALKQKADLIGVKYSGNIGLQALSDKIKAFQADAEKALAAKTTPVATTSDNPLGDEPEITERPLTDNQIRNKLRDEQLALVRCRVVNMNPAASELQGEIFTVANRYIGTVKKFIPYGEATDEGYHIPRILVSHLKSRKFQQVKTKKNKKNGQIDVSTRLVPEFNIVEMPPLTPEEIKELADKQEAAKRLDPNG